MKNTLLRQPTASRFYSQWLNANAARAKQVEQLAVQLNERPLSAAILTELLQNEIADASTSSSASSPNSSLPSALRRVRNLVVATLLMRDVSGQTDLAAVLDGVTSFADFAVTTLLESLYTEMVAAYGVPIGENSGAIQELIVLGMGKLGGGELNVSSDIDLIFVYGEDGETQPNTDEQRALSNHEFFVRLGKKLIGALSERTEDGFIFRVDMALRPHGASGPLVASFSMLEKYLIAQGREWERYAWIKARALNGRPDDLAKLHAIAHPFVYRRYLDFGAIAALRDMHAQIRAEVARQEKYRSERSHNVKLGRGGIREIEFLVQVFQLIRGGRDATLRDRSTRSTLRTLAAKHLLKPEVVQKLLHAYTFLRNLEHRLQYLDDAQTHTLPNNEADCLTIAQMMGFGDSASLFIELEQHCAFVATQFDAIFHDKKNKKGNPGSVAVKPGVDAAAAPASAVVSATSAVVPNLSNAQHASVITNAELSVPGAPTSAFSSASIPAASADNTHDVLSVPHALEAHLTALAFDDVDAAARSLKATWQSSRTQSLPDKSRQQFNALIHHALPLIASSASTTRNHIDTLNRLLNFLEAIARRAAYLALLTEYPHALERVIRLMSASGWAADYLTQHPLLLDELLDDVHLPAALLSTAPAGEKGTLTTFADNENIYTKICQQQLASAPNDTERQMDILREIHHAQLWRLLVQDLEGLLSVEHLADHLSALADGLVAATVQAAWKTVPNRHREIPRFAVIAYGRLGGKELGYMSDLDVIFLYEDEHPDAPALYARLAQRFITWMTSHTPAGVLFDIDIALRPDGGSGLLVSSVAAFEKYQTTSAWSWEHQALTRARFCAGDVVIGAHFETLRQRILRQSRDIDQLQRDILAMRQKMRDAYPNRSVLFDLKHDAGGMVDIEFIVQFLVLSYAAHHPALTANSGNIALLLTCAELGLIDADQATQVAAAYRMFRKLQHQVRLQGIERVQVDADLVMDEAQHVRQLWASVFNQPA